MCEITGGGEAGNFEFAVQTISAHLGNVSKEVFNFIYK